MRRLHVNDESLFSMINMRGSLMATSMNPDLLVSLINNLQHEGQCSKELMSAGVAVMHTKKDNASNFKHWENILRRKMIHKTTDQCYKHGHSTISNSNQQRMT
eukprot:GHVL01024256.1.p1 GENE.GHVL01024256.1~~GHVL01024256.1.p1  ORF type:complete len:103 (+),score=6.71 GHVL01024256.1:222-530(+)